MKKWQKWAIGIFALFVIAGAFSSDKSSEDPASASGAEDDALRGQTGDSEPGDTQKAPDETGEDSGGGEEEEDASPTAPLILAVTHASGETSNETDCLFYRVQEPNTCTVIVVELQNHADRDFVRNFEDWTATTANGAVLTSVQAVGDPTTPPGEEGEYLLSFNSANRTDRIVEIRVEQDWLTEAPSAPVPDYNVTYAPPDDLQDYGAPDPIVFSGNGDKVTAEFKTTFPLWRITFDHDGEGNFIVEAHRADGGSSQILANEIGDYSGTRYFGIPVATYVLEVTADGPWSIQIDQPLSPPAWRTPATFSGEGDTALDPIALSEGFHRVSLSHEGKSNFIVTVYDDSGYVMDLLVNDIGDYEGEKGLTIRNDGKYYLDVVADGPWSISFPE